MEMEASPADRRRCCSNGARQMICCGVIVLLCLAVGLLVGYGIYALATMKFKYTEYSVAINAVHGLDPATELSREHTLDPEFDLTVSISAYSNLVGDQCYEPGTTVEVTYHGVLLASAPVDKLCAPLKQTREQHVVAWGNGVRLPGFALDALVADARRGAEVFDVTVKIPSRYNGHFQGKHISCKATRVGDAAAALRTPCDVSSMDIPVPTPNTGKTQAGGAN